MYAVDSWDVKDSGEFVVGWAIDVGVAGGAGQEFEEVGIGVCGDIFEGEVIVEAGAASARL